MCTVKKELINSNIKCVMFHLKMYAKQNSLTDESCLFTPRYIRADVIVFHDSILQMGVELNTQQSFLFQNGSALSK